MAAEHPMDNIKPGIKVAAQMSPEPSEEDLQFARQMGVEYVVLWTDGAHANYDYFMSRREIFENAGLKIYGFGNGDVHCQAALVLNLPNRDEKVEQYKRYIRDLGRAGIPYTTYAHMANGVWSTDPEQTRGGAQARAFNLAQAENRSQGDRSDAANPRDANTPRMRFGTISPISSRKRLRSRRKRVS